MEKIGLKAVLEMTGFQAGMRAYLSGTKAMESETEALLHSLQPVGVALAAVGAAGMAFVRSAALTAARTEELGFVLDVLAENAQQAAFAEGDLARASQLTTQAIDGTVAAVKEQGITTQVATKLVGQFARYELDMVQASELARVAQDAAVISMQDSSQALDGLLHGILTYNPRVLRTYGITTQASDAFEAFADANGLVADELDSAQRAQAMLNAVLGEGQSIAGAYDAAMDSAGKQLRSLNRHLEEAKNALGEAYLPLMGEAVEKVTNLLKAFNELDPAQQKAIATMLGVGTVVATVGGTFLLLAPRVIATAKALGTLAGATKGVGIGLAAMAKGATAAEVASTGLAGTAAVAIPVLLALAAAAMAAYKAYELHQEIQARQVETSGAWTAMLQEQVSAGKSATAIAEEYTKAQKRVAEAHESGGLIADIFINKEKVMNANAETLNQTLATQAASYTEYAQAIGLINAELEEGEIALTSLTEAQWKDTRAVEAAKTQRKDFYDYIQGATGPTEEQLKALAELEEQMASDKAGIAKRVLSMERDYNEQLIDMAIDRARAIEDIERGLAQQRASAAAQLAQRLVAIEAQGTQQAEQAAYQHAQRMAQIEEQYQERIRQIQETYEKSRYDAIRSRDALALLNAERTRDKETGEAKRERDKQQGEAGADYARQQAEQAANLEAQRQAAIEAYQQQMADLEESRREQEEELDRSQKRQLEDLERHNRWTIERMRQEFSDEYLTAMMAYSSQEALYAGHLENMRRIWETMGGNWGGLPRTGERGIIGGFQEGGAFITQGPTTATFGEGGIPELVVAQPLQPVASQGGAGTMNISGTMRHEVSGAVSGMMAGYEGRLSAMISQAVMEAFTEVLRRW